MSKEQERLREAREKSVPWKKWGPYLSERQWGTVREDYSDNGDAWNYFTHDQARSRAYRWGEEGLGGISDDHQILCLALALWNGKDPILKERLFGLANSEGNHGEDVKEYYFYLNSTPTHSYMKYLYKYPQAAFPYNDLVETNRRRGRHEPEYELLDTGVFDEDRYFDVFVEYAKAAPEDVLIEITVCNRGPAAAILHVLPTLWFRNTWSWTGGGSKPVLKQVASKGHAVVHAHHTDPLFQEFLEDYLLYCEGEVPLLFTENETNNGRLFASANASPYVKDGINNLIVHGDAPAVNPAQEGTKAAAHYQISVGNGEAQTIRLRLMRETAKAPAKPFGDFDAVFEMRRKEADDFYAAIIPAAVNKDEDRTRVMRQALAGMLWSKQYFYYDLETWLDEHGAGPTVPSAQRRRVRNSEWLHMYNDDIISMPDKWEYPWFAAWDLAFHMLPFMIVDGDFAKEQLDLMLRNDYLHPNGQIPAYEWNFGDVNPPVHAYATIQNYLSDKARNEGKGDVEFLKYAFSKLLVNFTWWVNRKDRAGNNCFEGGFLGLDNIGVFDRSRFLADRRVSRPGGRHGVDGLLQPANAADRRRARPARPFLRGVRREVLSAHHLHRRRHGSARAIRAMWDEEDGFFYDVLRLPDGSATRLKVRSMVGLLPLAAVAVFEEDILSKMPRVRERMRTFHASPSGIVRQHPHAEPAGRGRPPDGIDRQRAQAPPHPDAHARRERVLRPLRHSRAVPLPPGASIRLQRRWTGVPGSLPTRQFRLGHVRR